jgi:putative glycosyltransferase
MVRSEAGEDGIRLSIVSTLYRSAEHLPEFWRRVSQAAREVTDDYEIILVNDGSPDVSLDVALKLRAEDERTKVVDLSRNFGHHHAIMAGLGLASGERVFLVDCDLEEPPELLARFQAELQDSGADVVFGVQSERKGGAIERLGGQLFYKLFNAVAGTSLPESMLTMRLMTRRYVEALLLHQENELFLGGVFELAGFEQRAIPVDKKARGNTTYTLTKRVLAATTAVTSFTAFPLVISFYAGWLLAGTAFTAAGYVAIRKLLYGDLILTGWTSVMISVWFLSGTVLISTGMLGIYMSRLYNEIKRRPSYIVRKAYGLRERPR